MNDNYFSICGLFDRMTDEKEMFDRCIPDTAVKEIYNDWGKRYKILFPTAESLAQFVINLLNYSDWDYEAHTEGENDDHSPESWVSSIADYYDHMELWLDVDNNIHGYTNDDQYYVIPVNGFPAYVANYWQKRRSILRYTC